jgi:hypothetical protein
MENQIGSPDDALNEGFRRLKEARAAFQSVPEERTISAMPVVVHYIARVGEVGLTSRAGQYVFSIDPELIDSERHAHYCEEVEQNAFDIRDEFLKLKTPTEALDFLGKTGQFSRLHRSLTWDELRLWQRFVYLIQEHSELARAAVAGERTGECAEVLKALTGYYDSSFFDGSRSAPASPSEAVWFERQIERNPELKHYLDEGERWKTKITRELYRWFLKPAGNACSVEWMPKDPPNDGELLHKLQAGGAMIEFLLPRAELRPVFLIRPAYTLEAIAATLFADRANGIEYRSCECCHELFLVGKRKNKLYCNQERCKNTAHQRRKRELLRKKRVKDEANKEITKRTLAKATERK